MILFLGFVFCVHHWNVSPEASMKETSNPGQARSFLRRVRNLVGGETCSQFCDCFAGGNVVPWQESTWMVLTPPTSTPTGMHPLAHIPPPPTQLPMPFTPVHAQSCLTLWTVETHGLYPVRLFHPCPWDSPGKNTGVDCHVLLQGIFLTQGGSLVSYVSCMASKFFTSEPPGKPATHSHVCINTSTLNK